MKFLQKLIPSFLDRMDHRLLINKPVIWRTRAHYLLFYASIIIAIVFSIGCFYPHSIYSEVYKSGGDRENIAIIITAIMSVVVIIFWSSRLYQYKTKISRWKHFFYTFCIYFFCLFILFTSVFSFHYGSFINRCNLLTNYKSTYEDLVDHNYYVPTYFTHYQENVLDDLDGYIQEGKNLSNTIFRLDDETKEKFNYSFVGQEQYQDHPVEYYERLNIIKEYLGDLEENSVEGGANIPEIYTQQTNQQEEVPLDRVEIAKRALKFELGEEQIELIQDVEGRGNEFYEKARIGKNTLSSQDIQSILAENNPAYLDVEYGIWQDNYRFLSSILARYEHYIRLRTFIESLSEVQYQAYFNYLKQLDSSEQNQFYLDEHTIQDHEVESILSHAEVDEKVRLFDPMVPQKSDWNQWNNRFYSSGVSYSLAEDVDKRRVALLLDFYKNLGPDQEEAYRKYIHFTRILNHQIDNHRTNNSVFNSETGLQDFVFQKCDQYFQNKKEEINRMDSVLFFNFFDSGIYSIKLAPEYYPKIIQKRIFDQFYDTDQANNDRLRTLMTNNQLVEGADTGQGNYVKDPDLIYKRQFLSHAFEYVGLIRKEATSLEILFTFLLVNIFFSFCVAILIFYLSSVERNTILLSVLIMGLVYMSLLTVGSLNAELVGGFAMLFYLLFSIGLFVVVYRSTFQIRRIKLLITCYIFYAITIQFFMLSNDEFIIDIGIAPEWMAVSILMFTFFILFFFSYYFIRYIQLPTK